MRAPDGKPIEGLSPYVIRGDDGRGYLMWGSGDTDKHEVFIAALKPGMTELAEAPRQLVVPRHDACGNLEYFESPILVKVKGRWLLTWIAYKDDKGAECDAKGSYVRYASADSMFGPFDQEPPKTLIYPSPGGAESTQQGMCVYRGREYLAYHVPYDDGVPYADHHRQVAITRLVARPDGGFEPRPSGGRPRRRNARRLQPRPGRLRPAPRGRRIPHPQRRLRREGPGRRASDEDEGRRLPAVSAHGFRYGRGGVPRRVQRRSAGP